MPARCLAYMYLCVMKYLFRFNGFLNIMKFIQSAYFLYSKSHRNNTYIGNKFDLHPCKL